MTAAFFTIPLLCGFYVAYQADTSQLPWQD